MVESTLGTQEKHDPLRGSLIRLRELKLEDLEIIRSWRNRWDVRSAMREYRLITPTFQESWFQSLDKNNMVFMFGMESISEGLSLVGVCGLTSVDWKNGHAELSSYVGNKESRHSGYYTESLEILSRYAFEELRLHMVYGEIYAWNKTAIHACEKRGFLKQGPIRDRVFRFGSWWDSYFISMVETEWHKRNNPPGGENRFK